MSDFKEGETVFVRTVTYHHVGTVKQVTEKFLYLNPCVWIADSGRFYNALRDGTLSEVEPMPGVVRVNLESIVDVAQWSHPVPTEQK